MHLWTIWACSNGFTIEGIISAFGTKRTSRSCLRSAAYVSICPSNLRRARVLAYGPTRHPITFASITPPIAELRHTPSLQWQRYGRRYVPLLSSHRSSRGRFVGGAPWSNSLKRYCRVAIVNIHCCSPHAACSASKRARAFFPSLAAAVMLKKKSRELSSGPHRPARQISHFHAFGRFPRNFTTTEKSVGSNPSSLMHP